MTPAQLDHLQAAADGLVTVNGRPDELVRRFVRHGGRRASAAVLERLHAAGLVEWAPIPGRAACRQVVPTAAGVAKLAAVTA